MVGKHLTFAVKPRKSSFIDITGEVFGRLTVLGYKGFARRASQWCCQCSCGQIVVTSGRLLRSGATKSCGCLVKEIFAKSQTKHGMYGTPIYRLWQKMRLRCENPKDDSYKNYGHRGITVCERWHDFGNFYADMGERPSMHTLERIDNNKGYSPDNCRWATSHDQQSGCTNKAVCFDGLDESTGCYWIRKGLCSACEEKS